MQFISISLFHLRRKFLVWKNLEALESLKYIVIM